MKHSYVLLAKIRNICSLSLPKFNTTHLVPLQKFVSYCIMIKLLDYILSLILTRAQESYRV